MSYIWNAWKGLHFIWNYIGMTGSTADRICFPFLWEPLSQKDSIGLPHHWKEEFHIGYCHDLNMSSVLLWGLLIEPPQSWAFLLLPGVVCVPAARQGSILVSPDSNATLHDFPDYWSLHGPNLFYVCLWEGCANVCAIVCGVKSQLPRSLFQVHHFDFGDRVPYWPWSLLTKLDW